ncbi:OstA-like protein, partial [Candidatus Pelagibacter sp. HIMB1587]|uniref:OstA-like protein n=1 Tax=Candidatus Pelagibacter sp. HIMB1587 TaxID=3413354 RepID=UPI003F83020A
MKNKFFLKYILIFLFSLVFTNLVKAQDDFIFDVTEIEILEKGNLFKGLKRGIIKNNEGIIIEADKFIYNKITNIVEAEGEVKVEDVVNNYTIFSDTAKYNKNKEIVITEGNSKGIDNKNRTITSDKLTYNKITNIV